MWKFDQPLEYLHLHKQTHFTWSEKCVTRATQIKRSVAEELCTTPKIPVGVCEKWALTQLKQNQTKIQLSDDH
jgi:hypothetical protein